MAGITETFMKLLERMDSLRFEEDNKEARAKRKSLVDKIQVKCSPFIMLCLGSMGLNIVICESGYKGTILQRNYRNIPTVVISYNFLVFFFSKKHF